MQFSDLPAVKQKAQCRLIEIRKETALYREVCFEDTSSCPAGMIRYAVVACPVRQAALKT